MKGTLVWDKQNLSYGLCDNVDTFKPFYKLIDVLHRCFFYFLGEGLLKLKSI